MDTWLVRNVGWFLVAAGIVMVLLAAFLVDDSAVAVALVVMGAGAVILGALVNRAEGPVELGPSGLKLSLIAKVAEKAEKEGLDRRSRDRVIAGAVDKVVRGTPGPMPEDLRQLLEYPSGPRGGRISSRQRVRRLERYTDELIARQEAEGTDPR